MPLFYRPLFVFYFLSSLFLLLPYKFSSAEEIEKPLTFTFSRQVLLQSKPNEHTWFHPRVAVIPNPDATQSSEVLMMLQKLLPVSDYFSGMSTILYSSKSQEWSKPVTPPELGWIKGDGDVDIAVADVTPVWHPQLQKVIAVGTQIRYSKEGHQLDDKTRSHQTAYAIYDPKTEKWTSWKVLQMPVDKKYDYACSACAQWLVEPDGTLLLPFYHGPSSKTPFSVTVVRCTFDGTDIQFKKEGNTLKLNKVRGLFEPSLIKFQNHYYLTLRNDLKSYISTSKDGLHFLPIKAWTFDDGKDLGSYNTQQHWVSHSDGLFLVYTRRGANNDHIVRHRAPLFMAQIDPVKLTVIRATEKIIVPEEGALLGNFGAADINRNESWVTVGERRNFKKIPKEKWKSNSVYLVKIKWSKPNQAKK
ncbi:sialidase family protein [uncultured Gimesia sp.]|uniref:sialidase family protein n=1 Tax=uncultured Gimesia sp. TaxID=1678688 RepID=UPI002632BA75|nr:sialidase family protein [uncultured Gimesia sp.]